jgi:hypothetical protein
MNTTTFLMLLAYEDAFATLTDHYNDIEAWVRAGRSGIRPELNQIPEISPVLERGFLR